MHLSDPVSTLPGIGPKKTEALSAAGVNTIHDLLWLLPKKYEDRNERGSLREATEGAVTIEGVVIKKGSTVRTKKGQSLFILPIEEVLDNGQIIRGEAVWFNQPWLAGSFTVDGSYYFYGRILVKGGRHQIITPQFAPVSSAEDFFTLRPLYPAVEGFTSQRLEKIIGEVMDAVEEIPDEMPRSLIGEYDLPSLDQVLKFAHCPQNREEVARANGRLKFEEALKINLGILNNRPGNIPSKIRVRSFSRLKAFEAGLPFPLTEGQIKVLEDIILDLKSGRTMNRLILGDVGSGKTVIAVACAYLFALAGYQTAYMAPTEILAQQHAKTFETFLKAYDIPVICLTGGMKAAERRGCLEEIACGNAQVIIGTHALIQSDVDYYNLGLVITDEQHRFGVRQRGRLGLKGERPHTLVMSATPIPRTLSLVLYGDLDISVINTMPAGRKRIKTYFYGKKALPKIFDFMAGEVNKGYQAFVVCPFIEASQEMTEVEDVERVYEKVSRYYKGRCTVGCLHGRMSEQEKAHIIEAYTKNEIQILVATSIIEVGIDVANVSVMTILSADRFGLSQLHQLRGRAGRGDQQAYCFLVSDLRTDKTIERMKVIVNHQNGQEIAEEDYRLRGPGDYFGSRQHGFPDLKALDPYEDGALIAETRQIAEAMLASRKADMITYRAKALSSFYNGVEIGMN